MMVRVKGVSDRTVLQPGDTRLPRAVFPSDGVKCKNHYRLSVHYPLMIIDIIDMYVNSLFNALYRSNIDNNK